MKVLKLDNFILYEYDDSKEHQDVINQIEATDPNNYLGSLRYAISKINQRKSENPNNYAFIAYYNNYPIGYISITYVDNQYQIAGGTLPQYRRQNLSSLLLDEFSEKILDYKNVNKMIQKYDSENALNSDIYKEGLSNVEVDELVLKIDPTNISSHKVAELLGYEQVDNTTFKRSRM